MTERRDRIDAFRKAAHASMEEKAMELANGMTADEIAEAVVEVHSEGGLGIRRQALREGAVLLAQSKTADRVIAEMHALNKTGRGVTRVGIVLATIQALTGIAAVWLVLAGK